jgi:hypothetical protein
LFGGLNGGLREEGLKEKLGNKVLRFPLFGEVKRIITNENGRVCFVYKILYTLGLDEFFHAHEVLETGKINFIDVVNLITFQPVIFVRMPDNKLYAAFRHAV